MRCAVCRCLRGALRSASSTASTNSTAAFNFQRGRSVFFRGFGSALPIASRTIRRCPPNFWAPPAIVPPTHPSPPPPPPPPPPPHTPTKIKKKNPPPPPPPPPPPSPLLGPPPTSEYP